MDLAWVDYSYKIPEAQAAYNRCKAEVANRFGVNSIWSVPMLYVRLVNRAER